VNAEQAKALREPFPPEQIGKLPKAGLQLDYVGHAATTDRLLQVDPEWTWYPFSAEERASVGANPDELWIWLTVCGVSRPGVGDGATAKIRIGDAIRNAAMRFGVALDLWAKEDLGSEPAPKEAPKESKPVAFDNETPRLEKALADAMKELGTFEKDKNLVVEKRKAVVAKQLPLVVYKKWLRDTEAVVRENIKSMGAAA